MTENSDKTFERGATLHSACLCCEHAAGEIERLRAHVAVLERDVAHLQQSNDARLERNRRQGDRIEELEDLIDTYHGRPRRNRHRRELARDEDSKQPQPLDETAKLT